MPGASAPSPIASWSSACTPRSSLRRASRGFYLEHGVADTFEGRFELLILHAGPVLKRLNEAEAPGPDLAQDLVDAIFRHLDAGLREMGVGDLAVPKRIKKLAEAFLGRSAAYDSAIGEGQEAVEAALSRNVFDGGAVPGGMAQLWPSAARALEGRHSG